MCKFVCGKRSVRSRGTVERNGDRGGSWLWTPLSLLLFVDCSHTGSHKLAAPRSTLPCHVQNALSCFFPGTEKEKKSNPCTTFTGARSGLAWKDASNVTQISTKFHHPTAADLLTGHPHTNVEFQPRLGSASRPLTFSRLGAPQQLRELQSIEPF